VCERCFNDVEARGEISFEELDRWSRADGGSRAAKIILLIMIVAILAALTVLMAIKQ
jgi:hypothetical protein